MQLSKQEFSKLPKSEREKLMRLKAKGGQQPPKKTNRKTKPSKGQGAPKRQASVAAAYASRSQGQAPQIKSSRDMCNIKHREFIGNVVGSEDFLVGKSLSVNPGLATTFPWLSVMAQAWEEYRFKHLKFCYYTRTGSNTTGSVIMAPDYDASDAAPSNEQIMSSYDECVEDAPWKDNCCALKPQLLSGAIKRHFVRTSALASNQDIKLYDCCNFYIATVDGTDAAAWGKLWVEYDVDFYVPQLPPAGANTLAGGLITAGGTLSGANPLGTVPILDPQSVGITIDGTSTVSFLTTGEYLVNADYTGVALSAVAQAGTATNTLLKSMFSADATSAIQEIRTQATAGQTLQISATATSIGAVRFIVAKAPPGSTS